MTHSKTFFISLLLGCLICTSKLMFAQDSPAERTVDVNKIQFVTSISNVVSSAVIESGDSLQQVFPTLLFTKGVPFKGNVPDRAVTKKVLLKFSMSNSADSAISVWFFPGFFYSSTHLYQHLGNDLLKLDPVVPDIGDNFGYRQVTVAPGDTITLLAELQFVRTHINSVRPRVIHQQRIASFIREVQAAHRGENIMTFLFSGLLLMMILFSIANYLQGANKEFLYYAGYAFFLGGMLFTKAFYDLRPNETGFFFEGYLDYVMQSMGIIFYMYFMLRFLETRSQHPFLYKLYSSGIGLLVLSIFIFSYFHFFTNNFEAEHLVESITKFILLAMTIVFLVYGMMRWDDRLLRFLFWGNLCLLVFSLVSLLLSVILPSNFLPGLWNSALFYYEIGLFLELVFFFAGLNFKNRLLIIAQTRERERLKTENRMKEYEKELAVYKAQQEERQRISADMHDELGAGMTAIRLMSEIARNKMKEATPVEIAKISNSANEVLNKMNAIIWSMNSGNDTLDNLVSYIRSYAIEYFESTAVLCKVHTPDQIPSIEITGDKRRNIFLSVKETLNNTLKHAQATKVTIDFEINARLIIRMSDNGKGIDLENLRRFGNGLKNIARRMESIGGSYSIENKGGTVTTLSLPL